MDLTNGTRRSTCKHIYIQGGCYTRHPLGAVSSWVPHAVNGPMHVLLAPVHPHCHCRDKTHLEPWHLHWHMTLYAIHKRTVLWGSAP